jgi:hypothetical protein
MMARRLPRPRDPIQLGKLIVDIATGQVEDDVISNGNKLPIAESARTAGISGGKARALKLTPTRRKEIAQRAARSRWKKTEETA